MLDLREIPFPRTMNLAMDIVPNIRKSPYLQYRSETVLVGKVLGFLPEGR